MSFLLVVTISIGVIVYTFLFQKDGLQTLPREVCKGSVSRSLVQKILKDTESVDLRNGQSSPDSFFRFTCSAFTHEKSGLIVEARIRDTGIEGWREWEHTQGEAEKGRSIQFHIGSGVVISWPRRSSLYLKCNPSLEEDNPVEAYALVVVASLQGDMRIDGNSLRQSVAEVTLQMARYAQRAVKCEDSPYLPAPSNQPVPL
ncbi:hypothetical protein PS467_29825 [Streptomyces luomodiensis]|uniref:Secreted protein n=1 Tax=Streptomyces luomodiensis TaxID=3026192 RepID=A0ABY9V4M3_9ACTN|nr:hypothetical protein [Streptomyces sp. SCA4-21]WNE99232.1 hypothetical protein PS467_29825 [Streptomyces sp. SCA4-21]